MEKRIAQASAKLEASAEEIRQRQEEEHELEEWELQEKRKELSTYQSAEVVALSKFQTKAAESSIGNANALVLHNAAAGFKRNVAIKTELIPVVSGIDAAREKRKHLHLRSKREVRVRHGFAWFCNIGIYIFFFLLARIYAGMFGEEGAKDCITGWAASIGIAIAVIEPVNIVALAVLQILPEDHPIRKCYDNVFYFYNEFLA